MEDDIPRLAISLSPQIRLVLTLTFLLVLLLVKGYFFKDLAFLVRLFIVW